MKNGKQVHEHDVALEKKKSRALYQERKSSALSSAGVLLKKPHPSETMRIYISHALLTNNRFLLSHKH